MKKTKALMIILYLVIGVLLAAVILGNYFGFKQVASWGNSSEVSAAPDMDSRGPRGAPGSARKKLEAIMPKGVYIVVDTGQNRLFLKKGQETLREAVISTGSGNYLEDPSGKRQWVFDTPRGEYYVKSKIENPYWVKPDWAFIEEGEPIPKKQDERVESGVLGDYALGFGEGYFIHGTLYTRLLGRNVTHGCVRVGDEDLKAVFKAVSIGTKIFIF